MNSTVPDDDNDAGDNDVCTGNHIRYLMFDTITAADDDNNGGVGFENGGWH